MDPCIPKSTDVVIIGAGVVGCSTAYHLAQSGITKVAVIEMDQMGSGSSGKSASMLSLQFCHDDLSIRMAAYCYSRYMQFEEELGVTIDFKKNGWLSLADPDSAAKLVENAERLQSFDIETEILQPEEIKHLYPEINIEDIAVGTWGPDDGPFDAHMIMSGYLKRAVDLGVSFHPDTCAKGIQVENHNVNGVITTKGTIATEIVINAAGPWAKEVGDWIGVDIPIQNSARSILVTGPFPQIPADRPFVEDVGAQWYFRPESAGILMGKGAKPVENIDMEIDHDMIADMIATAVHRVPILEKADMLTAWTGIRPMTADDHPILGPVPGVKGFVLNCGWGGTGIIMAPIAGRLIAEYLCNGQAAILVIDQLGVKRF